VGLALLFYFLDCCDNYENFHYPEMQALTDGTITLVVEIIENLLY